MKIAVVYRSMTGHSRKIARAIAGELGVEAQDVKGKPSFKDVDLMFVVGGVYSGESLPEMLEFVRTLDSAAVKKVALVTSSASDKVGQDGVRKILKENGVKVASQEYRCRGNFLVYKMGHPNQREVAGAVEFAKGERLKIK